MQVAKWMFTTVCSVSVLIDIIMIIVALGAADSACAESYTSGTSEYATCVQLYNALAPSILLFAGVLVALRVSETRDSIATP